MKTFTRFKETAYSGRFRSDGQLLVAGCEDSVVRLFDVSGKVALRMFKGHTKYVEFYFQSVCTFYFLKLFSFLFSLLLFVIDSLIDF